MIGRGRIRRDIQIATVGGIILVVAGGVVYRALAERYSRPTGSLPIPPGSLDAIPLELGDWRGRNVPLDEAVIRATDTDDHVSREYRYRDGRIAVSLFVAYGVRLRDLEPHRPEVCYPGAGWTRVESTTPVLELHDGQLPCQIHRFKRGGLAAQAVTVLNYYIIDGKYCPDVSMLRSRAWRFSLQAHYAAQVQIACPTTPHAPIDAVQVTTDFAVTTAPLIHEVITRAVSRVDGEPDAAEPPARGSDALWPTETPTAQERS